jgi:hypothetical protein
MLAGRDTEDPDADHGKEHGAGRRTRTPRPGGRALRRHSGIGAVAQSVARAACTKDTFSRIVSAVGILNPTAEAARRHESLAEEVDPPRVPAIMNACIGSASAAEGLAVCFVRRSQDRDLARLAPSRGHGGKTGAELRSGPSRERLVASLPIRSERNRQRVVGRDDGCGRGQTA